MPSVAAGEPEAMELPSYEDLGEATDLSAVEVAWRAWAAGWNGLIWMYVMNDIETVFKVRNMWKIQLGFG